MNDIAFRVIGGTAAGDIIAAARGALIDVVQAAYLAHDAGDSVNPPSHFLRFPDRPRDRIIALPASVAGPHGGDGIKWISSVPGNIERGLPRASAVLVLNDRQTGFPYACLEASAISAARTAASAALAADRLTAKRPRPTALTIVGTGTIARAVLDFLAAAGWRFDRIGLFDLSAERAEFFAERLRPAVQDCEVVVHPGLESAIRASGLVVFTTTAAVPHVADPGWFGHAPAVLHLSLRDLGPEVVLRSANFVDDVDHALREGTSLALTEQAAGSRDFVNGTLADILNGRIAVPEGAPAVFSPFGLGVLDIAVGRYVYEQAVAQGSAIEIPGFFPDLS